MLSVSWNVRHWQPLKHESVTTNFSVIDVSSVCMLLLCPNKWFSHAKVVFTPLTSWERRERRSGCLGGWTDAKTQARLGCQTFLSYRGGSTGTKTSLHAAPVISEVSSWWKMWRFLPMNALPKCFVGYTQISRKECLGFILPLGKLATGQELSCFVGNIKCD